MWCAGTTANSLTRRQWLAGAAATTGLARAQSAVAGSVLVHEHVMVDFIGADRYSADYRHILGELPQFVQASKADETSAKFMAWVFEVILYALLGAGTNGPAMRVLDGPTSETWITPWVRHLRGMGVRLRRGHELTGVTVRDGRIVTARVRTSRTPITSRAAWTA